MLGLFQADPGGRPTGEAPAEPGRSVGGGRRPGSCNALVWNAIAWPTCGAAASDTMMWRVHPDHGENAEIGKAKTSDHSRQTRVWRGPSPNNHLMSALQPADCGL